MDNKHICIYGLDDLGSKSSLLFQKWLNAINAKKTFLSTNEPHNADLILTCGEQALQRFATERSLKESHGYVLNDYKTPIIPCISPKDVYVEEANVFWIKNSIDKCTRFLNGEKPWSGELKTNITYNDFDVFLHKIYTTNYVSLDIETSSLDENSTLTAIALSTENTSISISPDQFDFKTWNVIITRIKEIISNNDILKIGQNIQFDFMMLSRFWSKVELNGPVFDTMHASNWINPSIPKSLEDLGRIYHMGEPWKGSWKETGDKLRRYNAQDAFYTLKIAEKQKKELSENLETFLTIQRLHPYVLKLETTGMRINNSLLNELASKITSEITPIEQAVKDWAKPYMPPFKKIRSIRNYEKDILCSGLSLDKIAEKERKFYYIAKKKDKEKILGRLYKKAYKTICNLEDQGFNPKSSKQCLEVLKNANVKLIKSKQQHTKEWAESTNDKALRSILARNSDSDGVLQFIRNMLVLRQAYKLYSSYVKAKLDIEPTGTKWKCSYNIEGTETGRSSSKKTPWKTGGNIQNIPRDDFMGISFKSLFIPTDESNCFVQADQEQAEARVVAALSGDKTLIDLFDKGEDIHAYAVSHIMNIDMSTLQLSNKQLYKLYRQYGKIINHGGNYNMGAVTLSESALKSGIDLSVKDATFFLAERKKIFPGIYEWHENIKAELHRTRILTTPFGRRRVFIGMITENTYREAYAHIPQSVVPHVTNLMWLKVQDELKKFDPYVCQMGHDSLLIEVNEKMKDDLINAFMIYSKTIRFKCGKIENFYIPWDISYGSNWGNLKKVGK